MKSQGETILGISIGTNTVGLVLMRDKVLVDWQVKTFNGSWSRYKERIIVKSITRYIKIHSVTCIALKSPEASRSSIALKALIRSIQKFSAGNGIKLHSVGIKVIKRVTETKNKKELMKHVVWKYPELRMMLIRQEKTKNNYYIKLFEAMGAVMLCL